MITNFGGNHYCGVVLCFGLFWMFFYMDGHFMDFMIMGDSMALPQCTNFLESW